MNSLDEPIDPLVERQLKTLLPVPARGPQAAQLGRAQFLSQAESLAQAVSKPQPGRHIGWIGSLSTIFTRKEHAPMFAPILSLLLVASLLLGGTGAAVGAAQSSLPDQPLYGIKIMSEDTRLQLAGSDQNKLKVDLEFAHRRIEEIQAMLGKGAPLPAAIRARLQNQIDQAFTLAAGLEGSQFLPALEQIRQELRDQEQVMIQLQAQAGLQAGPELDQIHQMIQARLQWADQGIADPYTFRQQFRQQGPGRYGAQPTDRPAGTPGQAGPGPAAATSTGPNNGSGSGANTTRTPQNGNGYGPGPYVTGTPTPGSGYGPGPGPDPSCTPTGNSYGPGPGAGNGYGPGPQATNTPASQNGGSPTEPPAGNGYGPGPGPNPTQTPGSGTGSGPNATQTPGGGNGPGPDPTQAPGGNGSGPGPQPSSTCTPQSGPGGGNQGPGGGGKKP